MFLTLKCIQNEGPTQDLKIGPQKSLIPPTPKDLRKMLDLGCMGELGELE